MNHYFITSVFILGSLNIYCQEWTIKMDSLLTKASRDDLFDGQVLAAKDGKIIFSKAYGNKEDGTDISKKTPLAITSVSKTFTALSILILENRGKLSLDDKLTKYYQELPYKEVTLRSLINMTSGLPRFQPTIAKYGDTTKLYSREEIVDLVAKYKPQSISPGVKFAYNGDNYMLLAGVIEKISGTSFPKFLEVNVFEPLEMHHTYIYRQNLDSTDIPPLGAGFIYSTAEDLHKFEQSFYDDTLLSNDLLNKSFEYTRLKNDSLSNYGYGWRIYENDSIKEVYVVGDGTDIRSSIQRYVNDNKTLIYIHNSSGSNWKSVYEAVRNIWEGKSYETPQKRVFYPINPELYSKYAGKYLSKQFGLLHITTENGKLYLRPDPIDGKEELVPSSDTTFYFAEQAIEWEFFLYNNGRVIGLGLKGNPDSMGQKQ